MSKEHCPTCGAPVESIFDHVDECPPEPENGYPATTLSLGAKRSMSPIGAALFNMAAEMGRRQAKIYQSEGVTPESTAKAQRVVDHLERLHRPRVIDSIRRPSRGQ